MARPGGTRRGLLLLLGAGVGAWAAGRPSTRFSAAPGASLWLADRAADRVHRLDSNLAVVESWPVSSPRRVVAFRGLGPDPGRREGAWILNGGGVLSLANPGHALRFQIRSSRVADLCRGNGCLMVLEGSLEERVLVRLEPGSESALQNRRAPRRERVPGETIGIAPWGGGVLSWTRSGRLAWRTDAGLRAKRDLGATLLSVREDVSGGWVLIARGGASRVLRLTRDLRPLWNRSLEVSDPLVGPVLANRLFLVARSSGQVSSLALDGALDVQGTTPGPGAVAATSWAERLVVAHPGFVARRDPRGVWWLQGGFDHLADVSATPARRGRLAQERGG